jgi:hypothetical protein
MVAMVDEVYQQLSSVDELLLMWGMEIFFLVLLVMGLVPL